jgi:hypothetical protein
MQIGEIVRPKNGYVLRSEIRTSAGGSETFDTFDQAVVVSLNPFILISEERNRLWNLTVEPKNFAGTGELASQEFLDWMNTKTFRHHKKRSK